MEHRPVVRVSSVLAGAESWDDTAVSWQQQIEAVFGRVNRSRLPSAGLATRSRPSPGAERREAPQPVRRRS